MKSSQEFTRTHELQERYYLDKYGEQRVERVLFCLGDVVAKEDYPSISKKGHLSSIVQMMLDTNQSPSDCGDCRYKVGDYTGDPGYLLYILFKTRLRLKFFKFKVRLFQIFNIPVRYKYKTTSGEEVKGVCGQGYRQHPSSGDVEIVDKT